MAWRRLAPQQIDHELLWLSVSLGSALGIWAWMQLKLPLPPCPFHQLTGWACPSCGITRCLRALLEGRWLQALYFNPLACLAVLAGVIYNLYALIVVLGRTPRWRWWPKAAHAWRWRMAAIGALSLNWMWLLWQRI
jgi:hypothetical protein